MLLCEVREFVRRRCFAEFCRATLQRHDGGGAECCGLVKRWERFERESTFFTLSESSQRLSWAGCMRAMGHVALVAHWLWHFHVNLNIAAASAASRMFHIVALVQPRPLRIDTRLKLFVGGKARSASSTGFTHAKQTWRCIFVNVVLCTCLLYSCLTRGSTCRRAC